MTEWVTVTDAVDILGMSERTIRRRIAEGKIESKYENGRRFIRLGSAQNKHDNDVIYDMSMADKDMIIKWMKKELDAKSEMIEKLRNELAIKNEYIAKLQNEIKENRERSDAIIIKLAEELEAQRLIFEGRKVKGKANDSFWRRIAKKEAKSE